MATTKIEKGKVYRISHTRKGEFYGRACHDDDGSGEWLEFEITAGFADAILDGNVRIAGEHITVRRALCASILE